MNHKPEAPPAAAVNARLTLSIKKAERPTNRQPDVDEQMCPNVKCS